jgi:maltooligosyltrehalose trehalohydrolase
MMKIASEAGLASDRKVSLGATPLSAGRWQFLLWAPKSERLELHLLRPREQIIPMQLEDRGYRRLVVDDIEPGSQYVFRLHGGRELPDPASRFQPEGVHGPSELLDANAFSWSDQSWAGCPLQDYVIYELHVGTYTPEGTFEAIIPHLEELAELGITAIEIMPVAQYPGNRNWGYDGVYPFAAQNSYGGPDGLRKLVDAAHGRGLAVVLDVVYNHLGPEGNYLSEFAPYFTERYHTPWGAALNFDGPNSDEVRRFFIESALYWLEEFHIDALRLDAIHGIVDASAVPFLADLGVAAEALGRRTGRKLYLIAESDLNDVRVLRERRQGGFGHDAQWSDDFHHSVHALLTGERCGYYADFGQVRCLATTIKEGWYFSGQYSSYRRRRHGNSPRGIARHRFVVCSQNHDQVGNRALSERLSRLVDFESLKLAAGITLLSPFIPLLFMGEEYGETAPFHYFTSHSDASLIEAVRRGRKEEFAAFGWTEELPDPQADSTFVHSKLNQTLKLEEPHRLLRSFYHELVTYRRDNLRITGIKLKATGFETRRSLALHYSNGRARSLMCFNFLTTTVALKLTCPAGTWQKRLDSADAAWRGPGSTVPGNLESAGKVVLELPPRSFAVLQHQSH